MASCARCRAFFLRARRQAIEVVTGASTPVFARFATSGGDGGGGRERGGSFAAAAADDAAPAAAAPEDGGGGDNCAASGGKSAWVSRFFSLIFKDRTLDLEAIFFL